MRCILTNRLFVKCFFIFSWMMIASAPTQAVISGGQEFETQRQAYVELQAKIRKTPVRRLNTLIDEIEGMQDYPLFPYLYYELVNRNIHYSNRTQIQEFLRDMKDVPIRTLLLKKWLKYLDKNNYKTLFLETYEPGLGTDLLCRNLHINRVKGKINGAWYEQVEAIWLSGTSLPKACDPVLLHWRKKGKLRAELAIQRIGLAGQAGQRSLTNYLKRYAPKNAHYIADLWTKVRRNPTLSLSPKRFPFRYAEQDTAIVEWGLTRMSWRDPKRVTRALLSWDESEKLPAKTLQKIKETVAISLTLDEHPDATEWLQRAASAQASHSLWRWYLANAVKQKDWSQVIGITRSAPQAQRSSSEFIYWQARALLREGNVVEGNQLLSRLAQQRHYYGFMSAAQLGQVPQLETVSILVGANSATDLLINSQALRARELFILGQYVDARREWYALLKELDEPQQRAAVHFAHQWGWYDQAIVGALRAGAREDLNIRFPLAYADEIESRSERYKVEPSFAFAIARRESSFMEDAVSSANARGLMQVLPSTADFLLRTNDILPAGFRRSMKRKSMRRELLNAKTNVEFGMGYLQFLQQKLGDNQVLIAAAYNAGWQNVLDWLPKDESLPVDIWIDTIPYKETREYVKAILTYQVIYDWHRNKPTNRFSSLTQMTVSQPQT